MTPLIALLYFFIVIGMIIAGGIIIFHLYKYSLAPHTAQLSITIFCVVFLVLLVANIVSFAVIPFGDLPSSTLLR